MISIPTTNTILPSTIFEPAIDDGRCGVVVRILVYYARGRGFDFRTVQTFVNMNMSVYIGSACFNV
jgi:hypothetical protein